tara:strand:+ start:1417 stop:1965 length:549 start_codon:yes stop_codon:yes gene_type:complete
MSKDLQIKIWKVSQQLPVFKNEKKGFKFKYTELDTITKALHPILKSTEIGYTHTTNFKDGLNTLTTTVFDLFSGESISSTLVIPEGVKLAGMNDYQSLGSALTYFRRYTLLIIFGILTGDDVDQAHPKSDIIKEKTDYLAKVNSLIGMGRKKAALENYFEQYKSKMTPEEQALIIPIISKLK